MKSLKSNLTVAYFLFCLIICLIETKKTCDTKSDNLEFNECCKILIADLASLSDEEIASDKTLMDSCLCEFYQVYDEFFLRRIGLEVLNHFKEIQSKIEARRDELQQEIDSISNRMNVETKEYRKLYMKSLNASLKSHAFNNKTPHCLDDDMDVMKLKLNKMINFKKSLKALNEFKSDFHFNEEFFGSLNLRDFSGESF